jgi:hypothetical protein
VTERKDPSPARPEPDQVVPELVAATIAYEAASRARAREALTDTKPIRYRVLVAVLFFVVFAAGVIVIRFGIIDIGLAIGFEMALLVAVVLGVEVLYLRRRVRLLTHLVSEQERSTNEPNQGVD